MVNFKKISMIVISLGLLLEGKAIARYKKHSESDISESERQYRSALKDQQRAEKKAESKRQKTLSKKQKMDRAAQKEAQRKNRSRSTRTPSPVSAQNVWQRTDNPDGNTTLQRTIHKPVIHKGKVVGTIPHPQTPIIVPTAQAEETLAKLKALAALEVAPQPVKMKKKKRQSFGERLLSK